MSEVHSVESDPLILPADIWACAIEYLPYRDMLQCCAVSLFFLNQVMPLVRSLELYSANELNIAPLERFSQVTDVNVNCVVRVESEGESHLLCKDTAGRVLHFLAQFPNLERAWLGGIDNVNYPWNCHFNYDVNFCQTPGHEQIFRGLVRSLCGAYRSGVLHPRVIVDGVICSGFEADNQAMFTCNPQVVRGDGGTCELCRDICNSFPLDWVMKLRQKRDTNLAASSEREWFSSRGAVCLSANDRISIVSRRSGGVSFLESPSAISCCLSKRDCRDSLDFRINKKGLPSKNGRYNAVAIDLSDEILEEIDLVLNYGFDPRHVQYEDIIRDYWRNQEEGLLPPLGCCYMTKRTYDAFVKFGFSIRRTDFFVVECDGCTGWTEGASNHPYSDWTFVVPSAWKEAQQEGRQEDNGRFPQLAAPTRRLL